MNKKYYFWLRIYSNWNDLRGSITFRRLFFLFYLSSLRRVMYSACAGKFVFTCLIFFFSHFFCFVLFLDIHARLKCRRWKLKTRGDEKKNEAVMSITRWWFEWPLNVCIQTATHPHIHTSALPLNIVTFNSSTAFVWALGSIERARCAPQDETMSACALDRSCFRIQTLLAVRLFCVCVCVCSPCLSI